MSLQLRTQIYILFFFVLIEKEIYEFLINC